ncbi:hypothetical protein DID77_00100 [Candidatus Marinamargulisbacteria bacterium SCGC AG-439-L15]|nr:hypothetical protein DID77_00100 [Candidatus Marinamargulisbacteria bacterium SCGC AG-439-L15]
MSSIQRPRPSQPETKRRRTVLSPEMTNKLETKAFKQVSRSTSFSDMLKQPRSPEGATPAGLPSVASPATRVVRSSMGKGAHLQTPESHIQKLIQAIKQFPRLATTIAQDIDLSFLIQQAEDKELIKPSLLDLFRLCIMGHISEQQLSESMEGVELGGSHGGAAKRSGPDPDQVLETPANSPDIFSLSGEDKSLFQDIAQNVQQRLHDHDKKQITKHYISHDKPILVFQVQSNSPTETHIRFSYPGNDKRDHQTCQFDEILQDIAQNVTEEINGPQKRPVIVKACPFSLSDDTRQFQHMIIGSYLEASTDDHHDLVFSLQQDFFKLLIKHLDAPEKTNIDSLSIFFNDKETLDKYCQQLACEFNRKQKSSTKNKFITTLYNNLRLPAETQQALITAITNYKLAKVDHKLPLKELNGQLEKIGTQHTGWLSQHWLCAEVKMLLFYSHRLLKAAPYLYPEDRSIIVIPPCRRRCQTLMDSLRIFSDISSQLKINPRRLYFTAPQYKELVQKGQASESPFKSPEAAPRVDSRAASRAASESVPRREEPLFSPTR